MVSSTQAMLWKSTSIANAVKDKGFDKLSVGDEVRFAMHSGEGEKGPQASAVVLIGKHHLPPDRP
jgi:'Cold-shock' DNA-binding domain